MVDYLEYTGLVLAKIASFKNEIVVNSNSDTRFHLLHDGLHHLTYLLVLQVFFQFSRASRTCTPGWSAPVGPPSSFLTPPTNRARRTSQGEVSIIRTFLFHRRELLFHTHGLETFVKTGSESHSSSSDDEMEEGDSDREQGKRGGERDPVRGSVRSRKYQLRVIKPAVDRFQVQECKSRNSGRRQSSCHLAAKARNWKMDPLLSDETALTSLGVRCFVQQNRAYF